MQIGNVNLQGYLKTNGAYFNTNNLVLNGAFDYWYAGTTSAPDGWALLAGGSVAQEGTEVPSGFNYSVKLTSDSDGSYLRISNYNNSSLISFFKGKTVTFSCLVHADDVSTVRLMLGDGHTNTYGDLIRPSLVRCAANSGIDIADLEVKEFTKDLSSLTMTEQQTALKDNINDLDSQDLVELS